MRENERTEMEKRGFVDRLDVRKIYEMQSVLLELVLICARHLNESDDLLN